MVAAAIRPAAWPDEAAIVRGLFVEYAAALGVDLGFQGFPEELATLPGAYVEPRGVLLLAWIGPEPGGCVGVRPLEADTCELKRLFVRPAHRGHGLARRLCGAALAAARDRGYSRMRLDTLPTMLEARALYRDLGFREIEPYHPSPVPGTIFMERRLEPGA